MNIYTKTLKSTVIVHLLQLIHQSKGIATTKRITYKGLKKVK